LSVPFSSPSAAGFARSRHCGQTVRRRFHKMAGRLSSALRPQLPPFAGGLVKNSVQTRNNSRVFCYVLLSFFLSHLRQLPRASGYRSTCIPLRFHVHCATEVIVTLNRLNRLGTPPVFTCSTPCRNTPVLGKPYLWKNLKTTALPASLAERNKRQRSASVLWQRSGPGSRSRTASPGTDRSSGHIATIGMSPTLSSPPCTAARRASRHPTDRPWSR
jgi:hypothetical protein